MIILTNGTPHLFEEKINDSCFFYKAVFIAQLAAIYLSL